MLASIVSLLEKELGAAARHVVPAVLHEVSALVAAAEKGEKVVFGRLADVLEKEAGKIGRDLLERIVARITHIIGPADPHPDGYGDIFHDLTKQAEKAIHGAENGALSAIKSAEGQAVSAVQKTESAALAEVQAAGKAAAREAGQLLDAVASGLLGSLAKEALELASRLAKAFAPSQLQLTLGPIQLTLTNIPEAVDLLDTAAAAPPVTRADLSAYIHDWVNNGIVDSVSVQADVALAALVVTSDDLKAGFQAQWSADDWLSRQEAIFDAIGLK